MEPRQHLEAAVEAKGGVAEAARAWGLPYPTLYAVVKGWRGVSRRQAAKWGIASKGELDPERLVWIRAFRKEKAA